MVKKYIRNLLVAVFTFFTFIIGINAKEVTIDELAEEVKAIEPNTTYIYMIGEYVFTSEHILTTQDVMLAARSINVNNTDGKLNSDPIYNEMSISLFEGEFDSDYNLIGLTYVKDVVGNTGEKSTYDISYIDYHKFRESIDGSSLIEKAYNTIINQNSDKFEISLDGKDINVLIKDLNATSVEALRGTGIATAATNLLNEEGVKSVTLKYEDVELEITTGSLEAAEVEAFLKKVVGTNGKASDLVGKTIEVTLNLESGYKNVGNGSFAVNFSAKVDVDSLIANAYNTIKNQNSDKFVIDLNGTEANVIIKDEDATSVEALRGTGIATAATNLLNEKGVEKVILKCGDAELEITKGNLDAAKVEEFLKKVVGTNGKASDLIGKSIEGTIILKDGFESLNNDTFKVNFKEAKKVDGDSLIEKAYNTVENQNSDKFEVSLDGKDINVLIKDLNATSVEALRGTGIATAATNLLNEEGIKSVTLKYEDAELEITKGSLDAAEVEAFLKKVVGTNGKASDLVGKTIEVTLNLESGYKNVGNGSFAVNFSAKVDADSLIEKAYNTIKNQNSDKFEVSLDGKDINVLIKDLNATSVEALRGTGIATAATNLLNEEGVKSVTLKHEDVELEITKGSLDAAKVEEFLKKVVGTNGKASDLVGKTIEAIINLESGYKNVGNGSFAVNFSAKVDVDSLILNAYNTIKNQNSDKFVIDLNGTEANVIIKDEDATSVEALRGTGIATAATNLLDRKEVEKVILKCGDAELEVTKGSLDAAEVEAFLKKVVGTDGKASDLVGKTIEGEIILKDGYESLNNDTFKVSFKEAKKVDVDSLIADAYSTIKNQGNDKFVIDLNGTEATVTIKDENATSVEALRGTGIVTAATKFLDEEGIKSVTLKYEDAELEITKGSLDAAKVEEFLKKVVGTNGKASDLIGKSIEGVISFEDEYKSLNSDTFKVNFKEAKKVDVDSLIADAYSTIKNQNSDKFAIDLNGTEATIIIKDENATSIEALRGTGIATAASKFLDEEGIKSVTLKYEDAELEITKGSLDAAKVEEFLKKVVGTNGKASDLIGKSIEGVITLKDEYKFLNSNSFNVNFKEAKKVDVDTLTKESYEIINKQASKDKFLVSLVSNDTIDVTIVDLDMNSAEALRGTGIATVATKILDEEGIKSVTLKYEDAKLEITKGSLDAAEVEAFFKKIVGTNGKASDLIGKSIEGVLSFEDEYKSLNSNKVTVSFSETKKVDVDTLVNDAYNIIKNQSNDKFEANINDNNINVALYDLNMNSVEALRGTGIATAASKFLDEEGIKSVTLKYEDVELEITNGSLDAAKVEEFLKKVVGTNGKASDLIGKSIEGIISFEEGYESLNNQKFSINFSKKTLTANFNVDGALYTSETVDYNKKLTKPTDPQKEGHDFLGWMLGDRLYDFNSIVNSNITLDADFKIKTYSVKFYDEDGSTLLAEVTVNHGGDANYPYENPSKSNTDEYTYTFDGFDKELTNIKADTVVKAVYKSQKNTYSVSFQTNSSSSVEPQMVEYGNKATKPENPTKTGYTFDNWYIDEEFTTVFDFDNTVITKNIELYAKYDIDTYTVNFESEGQVISSQSIVYGNKVTRPENPTKIGYTFDNFYEDSAYTKVFDFDNTIISENTKIYAKFNINTYTVTFDSNGGTSVESQIIEYGNKATNPNSVREGFALIGWNLNGSDYNFDSAVTENITLVAVWKEIVDVRENMKTFVNNASNSYFETTMPENSNSISVDFKDDAAGLLAVFKPLRGLLKSFTENTSYQSVVAEYNGKTLDLNSINWDNVDTSLEALKTEDCKKVVEFVQYIMTGTDQDTTKWLLGFPTIDQGLLGKTINLNINLKDNYISENSQTKENYTVTFK